MRYVVKKHEEVVKDFRVYMVAPNGEVCKTVAVCKDETDAHKISVILHNADCGAESKSPEPDRNCDKDWFNETC